MHWSAKPVCAGSIPALASTRTGGQLRSSDSAQLLPLRMVFDLAWRIEPLAVSGHEPLPSSPRLLDARMPLRHTCHCLRPASDILRQRGRPCALGPVLTEVLNAQTHAGSSRTISIESLS